MRRLTSTFDPNDYSNPADTYSMSPEVEFGSQISHESFSTSREYFTHVGIVAGAVAIAGLVALAGLHFGLCCRYFFVCCECRPKPVADDGTTVLESSDDEDYDEDNEHDEYHYRHVRNYDLYQTYPWNSYRICNFIFFLLFLAGAICFDQFFLVARTHTTDGVDLIKSNFQAFTDIVDEAKNDSSILISYGSDLQTEYNDVKKVCPIGSQLQSDIDQYNQNVQSLKDYISPLSGNIKQVTSYFDFYADGSFLFIFWGIPLLIFGLIFLFVLSEKRSALQVMVGIGSFFQVLLILLGVIFITFVMINGDFCTDPTYNLLNSLSDVNDVQDIAYYYATCQGNTTIQADLHESSYYINKTLTALNLIEPYCTDSAPINQMEQTVLAINQTIADLTQLTECQSIQAIWFDLINNAICTKFYKGIFYIWSAQLLTCFCLFFTLMIVTITYQFYPKYPLVGKKYYELQQHHEDIDDQDTYFNIDVPSHEFNQSADAELGIEMMAPPQSVDA